MAKNEEFDFEKEFGFDPDDLLDPQADTDTEEAAPAPEAPAYEPVSDYDLDDLLSDDFLASLGIIRDQADEEPEPEEELPELPEEDDEDAPLYEEDEDEDYEEDEDEDYLEEDPYDEPSDTFDVNLDEEDEVQEPGFAPVPEPAFEVDTTPDLGEEFAATFEEVVAEQEAESAGEAAAPEAPATPEEKMKELASRSQRRRKMSKERIIKEVYLPPIIAGLTLILIVAFIGGAIGRAVKNNKAQQDAINASNEASASAQQTEVDILLQEAAALAAGYDYEAAIAKIDTFSGEISAYPSLANKRAEYAQLKDQLVGYDDPASIANLSFHCLIADPERAFKDEAYGASYLKNFVTTSEFTQILQQLYDNGYVLVDFDSFVTETTSDDGKVTYSQTPMYLPSGKTPIMITETLVNYELFMVDSDGDGEADAGGDGFASKLMVGTDGKITCEYIDASGNTVTGAYDLVPILEAFIEEHPDFSYRGARAILAVSGEDGVFGYRTMASVKTSKGTDYYNEQVEGAKKIAQALREAGYTIACYTYSNTDYGKDSATQIQADLDKWEEEVTPVLGEIDLLVYAKGSDITTSGDYSGNRYNVLRDAGFRYFVGAASVPWATVTSEYVRQSRIMVTGSVMTATPSTYSKYFDASAVLSSLRSK